MPPRRWPPEVVGAAVQAQCEATAAWLASAVRQCDVTAGRPADRAPSGARLNGQADVWRQPSSLPGWTVADLARHLVGTVGRVATYVGQPPPRKRELDAVDYLRGAAAVAEDVRLRAVLAGGDRAVGDDELPSALRAAGQTVALAAATYPGERLVATRLGAIRWDDLLATRCVELVVHTRDLARSLHADEPALDALASRVAVTLLLQALERLAPGRSVEVRVPPYAAVQCVEGPRHTRGTPANVVEIAPVAWLDVATGRRAWADVLTSGEAQVSGTRADLGSLLPVMG